MNVHQRTLLFLAGLFGAVSVALAAVGAHALHDALMESHQLATFAKAVDHSMYGALTLLAAVALSSVVSELLLISGYLFAVGTLLFSGSLFIHTLAGIEGITRVTPIGGMFLIIGWLSVLAAAFSKSTKKN